MTTTQMMNQATFDDETDRSFFGHPRGLAYISFAEAWERFSFYGMQTLLVLYMVQQLLLPGHIEHITGFTAFRAFIEYIYGGTLSTVALASAIFGLYSGFVYLTPIVGGLIADRWLGKTTTITIGALLMAAGHFLMAFDFSFLIALLCLLCGVGCFKGNLASQVSELYSPSDMRRADAFQIYFLFINAAVIAAPLIAGTLGEVYGWHYGFGVAGVGMLISLVVYLSGRKWLPVDQVVTTKTVTATPKAILTANERRAIYVLLFLLPVLAIGSVGNQEVFNAYLLWVPKNIDLVFFGRQMPTTWLITLDAAVSVTCLVLSLAFWRWWSKRFNEPTEIIKITIGLSLCTAALLALVMAATISSSGQKAGIGWVLAFEVLNSLGFANIFPVGLALYARAAPKAVAGTIMGVYYLHLFMGNNLVGWLGGLLERLSGTQFWLLHAALVGTSMALVYAIARLFGHYLVPANAENTV
ncbi:peptide MFS transporter [Solimicrobium silvestre]|uniref:Amino acid/peptide transporter (Peptide:H+ symporter) n=1 Tax=Solimicrobium silvestre TaxID=2099400 RepID=A0A2S9GV21_9BURK|nr:peptide MFS transporter [Solimicrobium silvestre]PRC91575.1 Amino acid/peptide transporter (Peptide:H+ symporter) [Solimicrobium silvestre]